MPSTNTYRIAGLPLRITFADGNNDASLLPSFEPFRTADEEGDDFFFSLTVDDSLPPTPKTECQRVRTVDTGNGDTIVDLKNDGGYQFIIKDTEGNSCCLLITDKDFHRCQCTLNGSYGMRTFGLNNALMLVFAFAGSSKDLVLIHASLVRHEGWGYAFTAKSGTGKSTQVSMWLRHIPGCDLMNDDNPIIRLIDGKPYIYGSPWSGKTPCYRDTVAPLGAVTQIVRDSDNHVVKATTLEAFAQILASCSSMKWDRTIFDRICRIITTIIETTPIYSLHCRPDREAALVCKEAISRGEKSK